MPITEIKRKGAGGFSPSAPGAAECTGANPKSLDWPRSKAAGPLAAPVLVDGSEQICAASVSYRLVIAATKQ